MVAVVKIKYTNQIISNTQKKNYIWAKTAHFMIFSGFSDLDLQTDNEGI